VKRNCRAYDLCEKQSSIRKKSQQREESSPHHANPGFAEELQSIRHNDNIKPKTAAGSAIRPDTPWGVRSLFVRFYRQ
jgi:hypothetical protein